MLGDDEIKEMQEEIHAMEAEVAEKRKHCERQGMQVYVLQCKQDRKQKLLLDKS